LNIFNIFKRKTLSDLLKDMEGMEAKAKMVKEASDKIDALTKEIKDVSTKKALSNKQKIAILKEIGQKAVEIQEDLIIKVPEINNRGLRNSLKRVKSVL
jgi:hypothetical protein